MATTLPWVLREETTLWPREAGPVQQNAHRLAGRVGSPRGAVPSTQQRTGLAHPGSLGVEHWVTGQDPKAAGAGGGAPRSLAGWVLAYSKAV